MSDYQKAPKGCNFLLREVGSERILTPEKFTEQQLMFAKSAEEFMEREVLPDVERMEHGDFDVVVEKLKKAGEVGLLMIDIPEEYGGLQVDKTTSMLVTEKISWYAGFATSYGAHTGIGEISAQLGQIAAFKRTGMNVAQRVTMPHDIIEKAVGNTRGRGACRRAGEVPIEIPPIWQVARAAAKSLNIHNRHADHRAGQRTWLQAV